MKTAIGIWSALVLTCILSAPSTTWSDELAKTITVADVGFSTPESVEYDPVDDVYLVSNINGNPLAADGNGFISRLKPDGSMIALKWVDGEREGVELNAPKGMAVVGRKLFVADIDQVRVFELPSGKQAKSITIEGSSFLNGVTPGPKSSVYVTDSGLDKSFKPSGTDAVYQVWADGKSRTILKDANMGHPNGIWDDHGRIVVNTFGSGELFAISPSGEKSALPTPPKGGLDGLVMLKDGRVVVSSWEGSAIYVLEKDGSFSMLADALDAPADLGVDTKRNRLLIPLFKQNKVVMLRILQS